MGRKRLFVFILPPLLLLAGAALGVSAWLGWSAVERSARHRLAEEWEIRLSGRGGEAGALLGLGGAAARLEGCRGLARRLWGGVPGRLTVYSGRGGVHCETVSAAPQEGASVQHPEVVAALSGRMSRAVRSGGNPPVSRLYVAVPVTGPSGQTGALRVVLTLPSLTSEKLRFRGQITALAAVLVLLSVGLAFLLALRLGLPIVEMESAVEEFAQGALSGRITPRGPEEYARLARALNEMAARLGARLGSESRQRSDLEIVFSSMIEAVIAVDEQERLMDFNPSAARLFGLSPAEAKGRFLVETVRNADLIRFVSSVLAGSGPIEGEITLHRPTGDSFLNAQGNLLRDGAGGVVGAIVVLHDVTHVRKLEAVRKDFVANVSHELKTPITSIKGFTETLLDGALEKGEDARRFLGIIGRHAGRLTAIIEDLLALSRIEQEDENAAIVLGPSEVEPVLRAAMQACEGKAAEKGVRFVLSASGASGAASGPAVALINGPLLEQAVVNLLENAVKASPDGGEVRLEAGLASGGAAELAIRVTDEGAGIAPHHLERLFERFYRADPARSREEGGTGLGLAIVKHIAQAHGGRAEVRSTQGRGSTFSILIPLAPSSAGDGQ